MGAHLMHGGEPDPAAPPFPEPLMGGGYCGRWRLEGDKVFHEVEIASIAGRPGTVLEREWTFDGEELILVARNGPRVPAPSKGTLRWRRVGGAS